MPALKLHPATPQERIHQWSGPNCNIGRKPTNDLCIDEASVSSHHARIEKRGEEFWLVDLNSTNGTHVNGAPVHEIALREGDQILLGETTNLLFTMPVKPSVEPAAVVFDAEPVVQPIPAAQPVAPGEAMVMAGPGTAMAPRGVQCPACGTFIPFSVNFCPRCGTGVGQGAALAFPMQQQPVGFVRPMEHPGAASAGMMPLLALLCGLTIVGFPFALIFGLLALAHIRRHGGLESDRKQATWGVTLGFLGAIICAGLVTWYTIHRRDENRRLEAARQHEVLGKDIAENEAAVITDLKGIACAQKFAKVTRLKDPNKTGQGQYLTMEELGELRPPFFRRDLAQGPANGYRYSVRDVSGANFTAVAEPVRHGTDGKRTFSVDATGTVRGQDLAGRSYAQAASQLPAVTDTKSAFDGVDNAIANEVIAQARRLADAGNFDLCRQILDDVPLQFAMTTAAQELNSLKKSVDPFIIEAQASAKHAKADTAIASGDWKLGISLFKEISELYPTYSKITSVADSLKKYDTALKQKLESEAKALFEKAEAFERDGKPDEALKLYVEIEKNYTETDFAKQIATQKPALQKSIREKTVEQLFVQARNLSLSTDARNIVSLVQQIQRNYGDTDYAQRNRDSITSIFQKAQAVQSRLLAEEQMRLGRDADAIARLEEACANNPDARTNFRDLFLQLYLRVGRKRMSEGDDRDALRLFTNYLMLEPSTNELNLAVLGKLQFGVAKAEFNQGRYLEALQLLIGAKPQYGATADFNDLYGSVQVALGNYLDSLEYFDRAITAKPNTGNYHARRGYAELLLALQIERETMIAYAGLLRSSTNTTTTATGSTNATPTTVPLVLNQASGAATTDNPTDKPGADLFEPKFETILPPTVSGLKPDMQVRYDASASQALLDQILNLLDSMSATNASMRVRSVARKAQATAPTSNRNSATTITTNSTDTAMDNSAISSSRDRLSRIRTSVEFGKELSAVRQRILDAARRSQRSNAAMTRMSQLFAAANRDLAKAIQLAADHSPQLTEILKASQQHEQLVVKATPKITAYLNVEMDVIDKVCGMTESVYRNLRIHTSGSAMDPTPTLDIYFSRWCDRTEFDRGIQYLREAGSIKVPLETYTILPTVSSTGSPAPSSPPAKTPATAPSE